MLLATLSSLLVTAPSPNPLVAYSCRYYYPAGSTKTSVHQIYLSNLKGNHRLEITFDKSEKTQVQWIGKHKLAWIESEGLSERETEYGYHVPVDKATDIRLPEKLVTYDLRTNHRKVIARGAFLGVSLRRDGPMPTRGVASYVQHRTTKVNDTYRDENLKAFEISSTNTKVSKSLKNEIEEYPRHPWSIINFDKKPVESHKPFVYAFRTGYGGASDGNTQLITFRGHAVLVPVEVERVWKSTDNKKCWFRIGSYAGSAGCDQWIYEIDWGKGTCLPVANEVLGIDFCPASRYWVAGSNNKSTAKLGKLMIWSGDLWCGDLKTGKQWRIAAGAVHGDSAAVQP